MENVFRGAQLASVNVKCVTHGLKRIKADSHWKDKRPSRLGNLNVENGERGIEILEDEMVVLEYGKRSDITSKRKEEEFFAMLRKTLHPQAGKEVQKAASKNQK